RLSSRLERLSDACLNQVLPLEEYRRRRQAVKQQAHELGRQVDQLEAEALHYRVLAGLAQSVDAFCAQVGTGLPQATWAQKRLLVELVVDRVIVTDEKPEVHHVILTTPGGPHHSRWSPPLQVILTTPASARVRCCHVRTDYFLSLQPLIVA